MQVDETGELRGRVHVGKQDLLKLQDAGVESVWCHNIRLTLSIGTEASWICPTIADSLLIFHVMTIPVRKPGRHEKHLEHLFTTVYMIQPQPPWYRQIPGPLQDWILVCPTTVPLRPDVHSLWCVTLKVHWRRVHQGLWCVTWQENVLKYFSTENFGCFWKGNFAVSAVEKKIIFLSKFYLFWWVFIRTRDAWQNPYLFSSRPTVMRYLNIRS